MEHDIQTLLTKTNYHSERRLSDAIWLSINTKERKHAQLKRIGYGMASIVSIGTLVPASITLVQQCIATGFTGYFSLLFSDTGSIASVGKEIMYALGEALPVVSVSICLLLVVVCGMSLRELFRAQTRQLALINA